MNTFAFNYVKILDDIQWCQHCEMDTFVLNYAKILDDIYFFVIYFVVVFYTNILINVFSLICLTYNKCFNNMFCYFF